MTWVDNITAILSDKSIIHFNDDGSVDFFGSKFWKKNATGKYGYKSKAIAIKIWAEVESKLSPVKNK